MNAFLNAIINGALLSIPLTTIAWLALRLTPRRTLNAATRYLIWWVVLLAAVALPVLYLPNPLPRPVRSFKAAPSAPIKPPHQPSAQLSVAKPRPSGSGRTTHLPTFPIRVTAETWPQRILIAWAVVTALVLLRLAMSFLLLHRRKNRAQPAPPALSARAVHWFTHCNARREPARLLLSAEITSPVLAGPWRPAILIPTLLLGHLDEAELDQIGLHEAAHLARRDDYALLLQRLLEAVLVLNPLVHWITRRIELEREIACDDFVLGATGAPRPYARCLTRLAELSGGVRGSLTAAAAAEERSHLETRIGLLLDKTRHTGAHPLKARLAVAASLLAALVYLAAQAPSLVAFAPPPPQAPAIRVPPSPAQPPASATAQPAETHLVRVPLIITDQQGSTVGAGQTLGIQPHDFHVYENGTEQQLVSLRVYDVPLSICIVLDTSGSMRGKLDQAKQAVLRFLENAAASRPDHEYCLIRANDEFDLAIPYALHNEAEIRSAINASTARGGSSFVDALAQTLDYMAANAWNSRKLILAISDAGDNTSRTAAAELRARFQQANISFFAITVADTDPSAAQRHAADSLQAFATETGGSQVLLTDPSQLPAAGDAIWNELSPWILEYRSTSANPNPAGIQVELPSRPDLRVEVGLILQTPAR